MDIIPHPSQVIPSSGEFRLTAGTEIITDLPNRWNADFLQALLAAPTGLPLPVRISDQSGTNCIRLHLDPGLESLGLEGYKLTVSLAAISLAACTTAGVFYALQCRAFRTWDGLSLAGSITRSGTLDARPGQDVLPRGSGEIIP